MSPPISEEPLVRLRGLGKRLPSGERVLTILQGVDLAIEAGEFVAVLGPSGSGKSTLLGLVAGLDRPSEGEVWVAGRPIHRMGEDELALFRRESVGFVFQSFQLLPNLTARENVLLPLELLGRPGAGRRADELLARVGLGERGHHYPSQLSGGEQQRVALARAFAHDPPLLLADEPTGNLDGATGRQVLDVLTELRRRTGTTLVLVTHDPAVASLAERRVHLEDGRVIRDERAAGRDGGAPGPAPGDEDGVAVAGSGETGCEAPGADEALSGTAALAPAATASGAAPADGGPAAETRPDPELLLEPEAPRR